jgi:mevalonate kinase
VKAHVSAPGKSILMGEHAAVYGRPALVAALSRRTHAEMQTSDDDDVHLDLPEVGVHERVSWDVLRRYTEDCREAWTRYRDDPSPEAFRRVRGEDPAHLVKIALGEAAAALGDEDPPGLALRVRSEIPLSAGFGSSAAAAVAVVEAYLALRGAKLDPGELHRLTLDVERRQHGLPSGVDNATTIHGGIVWAARAEDGTLAVEPLHVRGPMLGDLRLFHSGPSAEATGDVVAAVRERVRSDSGHYEPLLDRMAEATAGLRHELESEKASATRVGELIRTFESCLEELGVVPEPIREVVRRVEERGGAAKISGAGSLKGPGAGSLLVFHPDPGQIAGWDFLRGMERMDLSLGAAGVERRLI